MLYSSTDPQSSPRIRKNRKLMAIDFGNPLSVISDTTELTPRSLAMADQLIVSAFFPGLKASVQMSFTIISCGRSSGSLLLCCRAAIYSYEQTADSERGR